MLSRAEILDRVPADGVESEHEHARTNSRQVPGLSGGCISASVAHTI